MTSQRDGLVPYSTRVSEYIYQPIIIACSYQCLISWEVHMIDMCAISTWWEYPFNQPSKFGTICGPLSLSCVRSSIRVLSIGICIEEEQFMSATNTPQVVSVKAPIDWYYEGVVLGTGAQQLIGVCTIDVYLIVMRADSKLLTIRGVLDDFNPFFGMI